jgi:hypothetical protein
LRSLDMPGPKGTRSWAWRWSSAGAYCPPRCVASTSTGIWSRTASGRRAVDAPVRRRRASSDLVRQVLTESERTYERTPSASDPVRSAWSRTADPELWRRQRRTLARCSRLAVAHYADLMRDRRIGWSGSHRQRPMQRAVPPPARDGGQVDTARADDALHASGRGTGLFGGTSTGDPGTAHAGATRRRLTQQRTCSSCASTWLAHPATGGCGRCAGAVRDRRPHPGPAHLRGVRYGRPGHRASGGPRPVNRCAAVRRRDPRPGPGVLACRA